MSMSAAQPANASAIDSIAGLAQPKEVGFDRHGFLGQ
jgi:hypothetical protein